MPAHPGDTFRPLTWRVENIPEGMSHADLIGCFHPEDQAFLKVKSLCPSVETPEGEEGDLTATVFFHPPEAVERPPHIATDDMMNIDKEFFGFTPLYVPPPAKGPIVADIIAVTGLAGHAFGSWAHSHERMWLRDYLPKDAPNTRILTYGYPSKLQASTSVSILQDHTNTFVHRLIDMRESAQCESRPIIFVGHSLGCLIIKKALTGLENMGIARSRLPVRAFIFLGAPHRGLNVTALQTLVKGEPTAKLIAELEADSATLTDLNQGFAHVAKDIDILTCYETRSTKTAINVSSILADRHLAVVMHLQNAPKVDGVWKREGPPVMMVSPNSAQQYYLKEKCVSVDADHSQIAKLKRGQNGVYPNVKSAIKHGLISTAKIMAGADASLDPTAVIDKDLAKVKINEDPELPAQPPPYSCNSSVNTTPNRPLPVRALSSSMASSPPVAEIRPESLVNFEEDDRGDPSMRNLTRTSTRTSISAETPATLTRSSTRTSIGMETPSTRSIAAFPEYTTPSRAETRPTVPKQESLTSISKASTSEEPPKSGEYACFCNICEKDVTNEEFHYTCDDCVVEEGGEDDGDGNYAGKTTDTKPDTNDDDIIVDNADETVDLSFDVCQKCFARGLQGPDHAGHKFGKKMVVSYGENIAIFPYPERQVFLHDSNIVKALKEGDWTKLMDATHNGENVNAYDTDGNTPLHLAIHLGLTACVDILLDTGASREIRDRFDLTPLLNAVLYNQVEILTTLLKKGADVNATGSTYSDTALHLAAMNGQHEVVRILLEEGAAVNTSSTVGTPLLYAAMRGHKKSTHLLLEAGANPNLQIEENDSQGTPLIGAAAAGKPETIRLLVEYGARMEDRTAEGYTALMHAAANGHHDVCETLLRLGANSGAKSNDGRSVLAIAAQENQRKIVELLLKHSAEIDEPNDDGATPLMLAMQANELDMVKLLRRCGADIDKADSDGVTLLLKAVEADQPDTAELLLKHGAKVDAAGADGVHPLFLATKLNLPRIVKLLIRSGAKVDKPDSTGETPLIYGVIEGFTEVCEELLLGNANVDRYFIDAAGGKQTPLMRAAMANKPKIVKTLLRYGATVDLPDSKGETPLIYAVIEGHKEVGQELLSSKADANQLTPLGATALMRAVQANKPEMVKILLQHGAAVDMPDVNGETPLVYGVIEGYTEVCEELLKGQADVDQYMSTGDTPLMKATRLNKPKMVELLLRHGAMADKPENKNGETPLIYAVIESHLEVCDALLTHGAYVDQLSSVGGTTPLMKATIRNNPELVKLLLRHGATVDLPIKGETPLVFGAIEGYTEVCEALLLAKADVNQYDATGATPLFKAVVKNNPEIVKLLLKYGAEVDLPDSVTGETPLMHGVLEEYVEVCEALLQYDADIEQVNQASNTPLMSAAVSGKLESVKLLVRHRPFLDRMPVSDGWTALTLAANSGHFRIVKYLLECGASAVPPSTFGKWKNFVFNDTVDLQTQFNIRQLLREYKHR